MACHRILVPFEPSSRRVRDLQHPEWPLVLIDLLTEEGIVGAQAAARPRAGAAYRLFIRSGFGRVSMDEIALASRLTKRTLYHHFKSKDHVLAEVLEAQHELAPQAFRTFGDKLSGSPQAIVRAMFQELAVWTDRPRWAGSGFTRLAIELADLPGHPARVIARRHRAQLESCLAELLEMPGWLDQGNLPVRSGCCRKGQSH